MESERLHYLEQLAELYPTIGRASTEIINLQSILYLPKGTEHFLSDGKNFKIALYFAFFYIF